MDKANLQAEKSVEFYAASVNAWYASALEHDKSIFALAGGGIALLVTLLTTVGFSDWTTFVLFAIAIGCFLATLTCLLVIFRKNQAYIEATLTKGGPHLDPTLQRLDLAALVTFGMGVLFAAAVGVSAAWHSFSSRQLDKEKLMATENKSSPQQSAHAYDSVNGAAKLQFDMTKSFNGAGKLQQAAATPAPSAAASVPVAPAPPPATNSSKPAP